MRWFSARVYGGADANGNATAALVEKLFNENNGGFNTDRRRVFSNVLKLPTIFKKTYVHKLSSHNTMEHYTAISNM